MVPGHRMCSIWHKVAQYVIIGAACACAGVAHSSDQATIDNGYGELGGDEIVHHVGEYRDAIVTLLKICDVPWEILNPYTFEPFLQGGHRWFVMEHPTHVEQFFRWSEIPSDFLTRYVIEVEYDEGAVINVNTDPDLMKHRDACIYEKLPGRIDIPTRSTGMIRLMCLQWRGLTACGSRLKR